MALNIKDRKDTNMKFLLLQFVLLFALTGISCQSPEVKVMTYNIRLDNEGDKENNWKHRKEDLVKYILTHDPDFIGVQEALYSQVTYLDQELTDYEYLGVGRDDGDKAGEFMALFYKSEKWNVATDSTFWLSETPSKPTMGWDAGCHRVCTYGVFSDKQGHEIAVFNTHFDHVGKKARRQSVQIIQSYVHDLIDKYPLILTGDFNIEPSDSVYLDLQKFLTDSRDRALEIEEKSIGTFNGFRLNGPFDRRIDYVFVNDLFKSVNKYSVEIPLTTNKLQLSDHFPVIVQLELK